MSGLSPAEMPDTAVSANERGNVLRLTIAQALAGANSTVFYATGAVVGNSLAPD